MFILLSNKLMVLIKCSNLRLAQKSLGLVLTIQSIKVNQLDEVYDINITLLSGTECILYNNKYSLTFNELSIKIKEEFKLIKIVFLIKEECFCLPDFNKNVKNACESL